MVATPVRARRSGARLTLIAACGIAACVALHPSAGDSAITHFGSSLRARATLTTNNLHYQGINTRYGRGVVHTAHDGADTALWNAVLASGDPVAPASGQITEVSLEGCAVRARSGPAPLTQIHFQSLSPLAKGAAKVQLTSQPFEIPVCGRHRASGSPISTYKPVNLCISKGDYVAFNDEGGFVENFYRAGVPYKVIASEPSAQMDSFLMPGGTGNGALMSPSVIGPANGFAANRHQELLLRATLATGQSATPGCRHGISG